MRSRNLELRWNRNFVIQMRSWFGINLEMEELDRFDVARKRFGLWESKLNLEWVMGFAGLDCDGPWVAAHFQLEQWAQN